MSVRTELDELNEIADTTLGDAPDPIEPSGDFEPGNPEFEEKRGIFAKMIQGSTPTPKAPKAAKPKLRAIPKNSHPLAEPLIKLYAGIGAVLAMRDPVCGAAIIANAEECAKSLENLARENDAVRRALEALLKTSNWGLVMTAHLPILMAIYAHHGPKAAVLPLYPVPPFKDPGEGEDAPTMQEAYNDFVARTKPNVDPLVDKDSEFRQSIRHGKFDPPLPT